VRGGKGRESLRDLVAGLIQPQDPKTRKVFLTRRIGRKKTIREKVKELISREKRKSQPIRGLNRDKGEKIEGLKGTFGWDLGPATVLICAAS